MQQIKVLEGVMFEIHKLYDLLYPDTKKNFKISARIVAFVILNNQPTKARMIIEKFLELYAYQFDMFRDLDDDFAKMARDFLATIREHIFKIHSYESPWYKPLEAEWDHQKINSMKEEAQYNDEIPLFSVKDVESATGKSRQTVYNYIEKLGIPKYGDGQNAFKKRDYNKLIRGISGKE